MSEYVYFLRNPKTGLTKIGRSVEPHARKKGLEAEHKTNLEVIAVAKTNDSETLEAEMHKRYRANRVTGEWFDLRSPLQEARNSLADKLLDWSEAVRVKPRESKEVDDYIKRAIKARIKELGTTQADVARRIGVTPQAVNNVLKPDSVPIPSSLVNVLKELGLKLIVVEDEEE